MNRTDNATQAEEDVLGFYVEGVALTAVSAFGLAGSAASLFVLLRCGFSGRHHFSNLLCGLAAFDGLFLATALASFGLPRLSAAYAEAFFVRAAPAAFGMIHTFRVGSAYVTMAVTVERFLVVWFPLRTHRWKRLLLPAATAFAVLYNVPKYFEVTTEWDEASGTHRAASTDLRKHPAYATYYVFWSKLVLTEVLPYVVVLVLNVAVVAKIFRAISFQDHNSSMHHLNHGGTHCHALLHHGQQHHHQQQQLQQQQQHHIHAEEKELCKVLVGISVMFILCQSLKIVPDLYEMVFCYGAEECEAPFAIIVISEFSHLLACANSASNFLFYLLHGRKFRRAFAETFFCARH